MNGEFASKLQGAQNEYIYFGTNTDAYGGNKTGTIKWRVLHTGIDNSNGSTSVIADKNRYGSGMLLWADYQLGKSQYNTYTSNPEYAFWGTSKIRAALNGGTYYNAVSNTTAIPTAYTTVNESASWYVKLFSADEQGSVEATGSYDTDNWGMVYPSSSSVYNKEGITTNSDSQNGKYNTNRINSSHPTSQYATVTSAGGVQESTSGDKLFLLDYYDINNPDYGFGDDGVTYAKSISASWAPTSNIYVLSGSNVFCAEYLKFSGETSTMYWLRTAGRFSTTESDAMYVYSGGTIPREDVSTSLGVRPAFNLNPSSVVYATAASLTSVNTTLTSVNTAATTADNKPAYKVYIKGGSYDSSTNSAKSYMAVNDNVITIAYNNPASQASGTLVLLLSNSDGSVAYQAEQGVSGVVSGFNTVNFTLPAGVTYSDYTATLLYTSANGGASSETVYCTYSLDSKVDIPSVFNTEYKNSNQWIGSLDSAKRPNWYNEKLHGNESFVTVKSIKYTDNIGTQTDVDVPITNISLVEAGTYKVTLGLASGLKWSTGDSNDKTFNIVIAKAQPSVEVQTTGTLPTYAPDTLEEIGIALKPGGTAGTVAWKTGQLPTTGENVPYTWVFTPDVPNNYEEKEDTLKLTFKAREIDNVEAVFTPNGDIFTNTTEATLCDCTVVTITYKGTPVKTETTTNYEFLIDNDGVDELVEGDNYFKVRVTDQAANGKKVSSALVKIEGVKKLGYSAIDSLAFTGKTFTYPVTADDIIGAIRSATLIRNDGHTDDVTDAEEIKNIIVLTDDCDLNAGTGKSFKFKIAGADDEKTYGGFTVNKGTYNIPDSVFVNKTVTDTGSAYDPDGWIDITKLPAGMTVSYTCSTDLTSVGTHTVTATFSNPDPDNYNDPATKTATLTISDKPTYDMDGVTFDNAEVEYDGNSHTLEISGDLPDGVTVKYFVGDEEFTGATDVDDYTIVAKFTGSNEFAPIDDRTATLKITKADYDMSGVTFEDKTVTYDGEAHSIFVGGVELPDWITVVYTGNGVAEVGTHTVVAKFNHENGNYNPIDDKTAKLIISDAVVVEIKAELSEKEYTTANTLDDLKAKLKVTAVYNNGTTEIVTDYELSFTGLSDDGKLKYGTQPLTVSYGEFTAVVNNVMVSRQKVALPSFKGGLSYTGVTVKPTVDNFNGYDSALMTFVTDKLQSGLAVGSYKAVFALNDPENYEWATATTLKKSVFAVALDEMLLNTNEAAVDWNISKAVLTATKTDGGLPVFASDSYIGAFADVVTLKYYKDEACTEEVAADQLAKETQYFVKAELLDTENFELDASAAQYTVKSFTYTTPAKELTTWDKIVRFIKTNWLWLVIAVAALVLLILIIALAARSAKKKREREEQRRLEEKEERRREQEERDRREEERRQREDERRREEREERMAARMAQPQMMMPQMPQMPQMQAPQAPQPQYAPQAAPSVSDSALLISIENQLSALRSEQTAATRLECEMAKLRADLKVGQPLMTDANTGKAVTVYTLTEIITLALKNVLAPNAQQAAEQKADNAAAPAVTQVPPDAVMTTVTTTKIDTTKKPVQNAQAQGAPVRTVVRNVVAPMPVDDGRVFDVGGFYKPADPITDMGFTDDDKSE